MVVIIRCFDFEVQRALRTRLIRAACMAFAWLLPVIVSAKEPLQLGQVTLGAAIILFDGTPDGKRGAAYLGPTDDHPLGIQILDLSIPQHPKLQAFIPLAVVGSRGQMSFSEDGRELIVARVPDVQTDGGIHIDEIIQYDLADPMHPRELKDTSVHALTIGLAPNATGYAAVEPIVEPYRKGQPTHLVIHRFDRPLNDQVLDLGNREVDVSGIVGVRFSLGSSLLMIEHLGGDFDLLDLSDEVPILYQRNVPLAGYGYVCHAILDNHRVLVSSYIAGQFELIAVKPGLPRLIERQVPITQNVGFSSFCRGVPTAKESLAVFSGKYGKLIEFDLSKQNNTSKNRIWSLPSYVKSMYVDKIGYLYAAAADEDKHSQSLLIFDLNQSNEDLIDWTALSVANDKAMRGYANGSESYTPMLIMERAGIRRALTTPVEGISPAKAAEILDNFGFMVARQSPSDGEAFIRRAIELDPTRTIAYLNLADLIRSRLGDEVEWKEKQRATNEANDLYERYLALGGSRTPEIAAFLLGDLGKDYPNDLCRVIASYAKAGRLAELLSNNPKRIMAGKRLVNLLFTTQGTAHLPAIEAYDAETDERLDDDAIRLPDGADFDSSDGLSLVSYRNVYQILHYTDAAHPISSMTLSGDAACRFDSDTADQ